MNKKYFAVDKGSREVLGIHSDTDHLKKVLKGIPLDFIEITPATLSEFRSVEAGSRRGVTLSQGGAFESIPDNEDLLLEDAEKALLRLNVLLKRDFMVKTGDNVVYTFNLESYQDFTFKFCLVKNGINDILKWSPSSDGSGVPHSVAQADELAGLIDSYRDSVKEAVKQDRMAIEVGDYSLSNITPIKEQQDLLRGF